MGCFGNGVFLGVFYILAEHGSAAISANADGPCSTERVVLTETANLLENMTNRFPHIPDFSCIAS